MKRGYFVGYFEKWEEMIGIGVVGKNMSDAKFHAFSDLSWDEDEDRLRVFWAREANVNGLDYGVVELNEGLKRGFYKDEKKVRCQNYWTENKIEEINKKCVCGKYYDKIILKKNVLDEKIYMI